MSVASFANIFSQSVGCLFVFFRVPFVVQILLNLIKSSLYISVFIVIILGGGSEKYCSGLCRRVFGVCSPLRVL